MPDVRQWMFDILTSRTASEPEVEHFVGLEFLSHEVFAEDVAWLERLEQNGMTGAAIGAATWREWSQPELLPVLRRLTDKADDDFYVWELALQLATCYREVAPRAEALGLAKLLTAAPEVDVILLWDEDSRARARIAVVHPKVPDGTMDVGTAWKWIDAFLPPAVRGALMSEQAYSLAEGAHQFRFAAGPYAVIHQDGSAVARIDVYANGVYETHDLEAAFHRAIEDRRLTTGD